MTRGAGLSCRHRRLASGIFVLYSLGLSACFSAASESNPFSTEAAPGLPAAANSFSSAVSSLMSVINQFLVGDGNAGSSEGFGGDQSVAPFLDFGRKAVRAASSSLAADETREGLWVPLHENLGMMRDYFGVAADDAQGVQSAARLLLASQLPLLRFAAEREQCTDPQADLKALRLVTEFPSSKKMLLEYMELPPDRNLPAAQADLVSLNAEMKEYLAVLRGAGDNQVLPVSILGGLDFLSSDAAAKVSGYLATVARYFMYGDRFTRNKRGLVFFARQVLPRVLQLFALQLDACRHLWRFISEVSTQPATSSGYAAGPGASSTPRVPLYEDEFGGALGALAQNLGFKTPSVPYAQSRAFARRLLARVQVQIWALYSLSRGCLAATSLSFQRQYAEAQAMVELGESPSSAFQSMLEETENLSGKNKDKGSAKTGGETAERNRKANPRLRALARGEDGKQEQQTDAAIQDVLIDAPPAPPTEEASAAPAGAGEPASPAAADAFKVENPEAAPSALKKQENNNSA